MPDVLKGILFVLMVITRLIYIALAVLILLELKQINETIVCTSMAQIGVSCSAVTDAG